MPTDIGVIDLMIGFPQADRRHNYDFLRANLRDRESLEDFEFPAQYMFKNVPSVDPQSDPVAALLELMDKYGIDRAMIGVSASSDESIRALRDHADRFFGCVQVDPNRGMEAVRDLQRAVEELGVKAASAFPCGLNPPGPDQRQEVLPDLCEVCRARHPDQRLRGSAGTSGSVRTPVRRLDRRGVLVLSRTEVRDPARLRTLG